MPFEAEAPSLLPVVIDAFAIVVNATDAAWLRKEIMRRTARSSQHPAALTSWEQAHKSVAVRNFRNFWFVTDRPRLDFSEYLPYLINRVGSALVADFGEDALAHYGLSIAMWRVLAVLSNDDGQRQIDLAAKTSIDVSTLSRVVSRLVKLALVTRTRSATNSREVTVRLTAKGVAILARVIPKAIAAERTAIAGVSATDLAVVRRSLRRMYQNLALSAGVSERSEAPHGRGRAASAVSSRPPRAGERIRR